MDTSDGSDGSYRRRLTAIEKQLLVEARLGPAAPKSPHTSAATFDDPQPSRRSGLMLALAPVTLATAGIALAYFAPGLYQSSKRALPVISEIEHNLHSVVDFAAIAKMGNTHPEVSDLQLLATPIDEVMLSRQPKLFSRQVGICRSVLRESPNNEMAKARLASLQTQVVRELEAAVITDQYALAQHLFARAYQLLPEITEDPRYEALIHPHSDWHKITEKTTGHKAVSSLPTLAAGTPADINTEYRTGGSPTASSAVSDETSDLVILASPVEDITLSQQPDLFNRHVKIYRAILSENPQNQLARARLEALQEHSLDELEAAVNSERYVRAKHLFADIYQLLPEITEHPRYLTLIHPSSAQAAALSEMSGPVLRDTSELHELSYSE